MTEGFSIVWAVLLLPIGCFLLLALLGSRLEAALGKRGLAVISVLPIFIAFALSALATKNLSALDAAHRSVVVAGPPWIDILGLKIPFELTVDPLSMTMALIITGIGSLIFLYSTGYMAEEREYSRFFTYMNLFAASMLLLVLANNLPLLFVGWEGVGLCSYLLIGFWYKDPANAKAANKAFIVNRIGDWGFMLGIFLLLVLVVTGPRLDPSSRYLSFDVMLPALRNQLISHPWLATTAGLLLFVGAAGKSAQFPLYIWLPDAMAGPTPVSALIHAATMVTSGVVLLNRMHVVFEVSGDASAVVCCIGAFTALYAAIIAFSQTDIKRVLAYSTVSQLGFMFIGCGAGAYWAGIFHVTTHAFFKALLFLGAGAVIHSMAHDQDMRHYGMLRKYLPITTWTMVLAGLAIAAIGIPGLFGFAGYYSKEALLGAALGNEVLYNQINVAYIAGWVGLFTALLTAGYIFRMLSLTFFGKKERWRDLPVHEESHVEEHHAEPIGEPEPDPYGFYLSPIPPADEELPHGLSPDHTPKEVSASMWLPLAVLAALSVIGGWFLANGNLLENWLAPVSGATLYPVQSEAPASIHLPELSLVAALLGIVLGLYMAAKETKGGFKWPAIRTWAGRQFGYDEALTTAGVGGGAELATGLWKWIDIGLFDMLVNGAGVVAAGIGKVFSGIQRGLARSYAMVMLVGGLAVLLYMVFGGAK